MSRYAKPGQTIEDLKSMITDNGGVKETIYNDKLKVHIIHRKEDATSLVSVA